MSDHMQRRAFLTGMAATAGAAALPRGAGAQAPTAMLRVGAGSPQPRSRSFLQEFDVRMRELGYVEGQNYTMDYFDLQGRVERYGDAMQQLVDRKPDVIVAIGPEESLKAALAAQFVESPGPWRLCRCREQFRLQGLRPLDPRSSPSASWGPTN